MSCRTRLVGFVQAIYYSALRVAQHASESADHERSRVAAGVAAGGGGTEAVLGLGTDGSGLGCDG